MVLLKLKEAEVKDMANIKIEKMVVGMMQTNCYLVYDEDIKEAIIVDPGASPRMIKDVVGAEGVKPVAIFLTHAHLDHIGALKKIKEEYNIPIYIHTDEELVLQKPAYNLSNQGYELHEEDVRLVDGQELVIGGMNIKVIHTPGHTPGSACYYFPDAHSLLSGDTMFCCSWGRTDFPGGSEMAIMRSIREKLLTLPENTDVYPGHEMYTTIKNERRIHGYRE